MRGLGCVVAGERMAKRAAGLDESERLKAELDPKANRLTFSSADRQLLGQVCAEIRKLRVPDPYKAKGIKYSDEVIRRKVGKAGAK